MIYHRDNSRNERFSTQCPSRPPCDMVIRSLSANAMHITFVSTPLTVLAAVFVPAGKACGTKLKDEFSDVTELIFPTIRVELREPPSNGHTLCVSTLSRRAM